MDRALFDLETNEIDKTAPAVHLSIHTVHCGVVVDLDTGEIHEFVGSAEIKEMVEMLSQVRVLSGHNICGFDVPVLERLYDFDPMPHQYLDTLAMSRSIFPGSYQTTPLRVKDIIFCRKHGEDSLPKQYWGLHSLKSWSLRLRLGDEGKAEYTGGWEKWSPEMQAYCVRDVKANVRLLEHFLKKGWSEDIYHVESMLTYHLSQQQAFGINFNEDAAIELLTGLCNKRSALRTELAEVFPPIIVPNGKPKVAARDRVCRKYEEGHPKWFPPRKKGETYQLYKEEAFKPNSGPHITKRLAALYDWEPQNFTPGGQAQVTDEILRDLPWPEAQKLADYAVIQRILGYVSEGKQAWLDLQNTSTGRIHGSVQATGATTTRAAHSGPNLAQTPKEGKPYGKECRELFTAGEGRVLVGADASSLQLALYSHFVAKYDGGHLAAMCESEDGDPHEYMREASGLFTRDCQKNLTYATWFGAGLYKQGLLVLADWRQALREGLTDRQVPPLKSAAALGSKVNSALRKNMKGYRELGLDCEDVAKRGYLTLLDGHRLDVSQARMVLVTLLQGNEAVVMKQAYLLAAERLRLLVQGGQAHPVLWIHDELQWESVPEHRTYVGQVLTQSITDAGAFFGLRLKLGAKYKVGETWAETH